MQPMINALLDPVVNFGKVTVSGGYDSLDTEIHLITGDGSKLPNPVPSGSFNIVWFNNSTYSDPADDPYVEIVRCIARVGDTLTLMRGQELTVASPKNILGKLYNMVLLSDSNLDTNLETLSYYNVPQIHGKTKHDVTTIDGGIALPIGQLPAHGIGAHTGTIGTWANIDKTTSSIVDITTRSHTLLTDIGTNTHTTIDTAILNSMTHIGASIAHNITSDIVGISDIQTLTNKTLTSPFISTIYGGSATDDDITIEGTSNAIKTSSYVILQPTSGNVGIGTTIPTAKLHIGGISGVDGIKFPDDTLQTTAAIAGGWTSTTKTYADSPFTASTDNTILCDATGGNMIINLPPAASNLDKIYNIKKIDSSANTVTIDGNASETIDGTITQIIPSQYDCLTIQSNGSNWYII